MLANSKHLRHIYVYEGLVSELGFGCRNQIENVKRQLHFGINQVTISPEEI